jgi:hypothetical protein
MTESGRGVGIWSRVTRHEQRRVGAGRWQECAAEKRHDVSRYLPHCELTEILSTGSRRGKKELCIPDASLQRTQVGRLTGARNHHIDVLVSVCAKTFRQAIWGHYVILWKHDDE